MCMLSNRIISNLIACDVTLSVYPHRASMKNIPDHGGNRTLAQCYRLRVYITSNHAYSPEYITPTQKK